ncbi:hypothetical protein POTOM_021916 [Populus tomentosa]|uniref:Pentatricopeptide repeat-containing protein n=1 Tax=Populus tomentosa TaxID=118781 RepID=A0A8X8CSX7_POPTO|nr:hypothetical protein POTOM_021916 [Populus tomentosa]
MVLKALPSSSSSPSVAYVSSSRPNASSIGKLLSLSFSNPQKPTSSNPKNQMKNPLHTPKLCQKLQSLTLKTNIPLQKLLKKNCKLGKFTLNEAVHFFDHMINTRTPLLQCHHSIFWASDGLLVFGRGFRPNAVTFSSMIKGLCVDDKIGEAVGLFKKMGLFGCWPNVVTYEILINGLCSTVNTSVALKLHE